MEVTGSFDEHSDVNAVLRLKSCMPNSSKLKPKWNKSAVKLKPYIPMIPRLTFALVLDSSNLNFITSYRLLNLYLHEETLLASKIWSCYCLKNANNVAFRNKRTKLDFDSLPLKTKFFSISTSLRKFLFLSANCETVFVNWILIAVVYSTLINLPERCGLTGS